MTALRTAGFTPAPLPLAALEAAIAEFGSSFMLPPEAYTSDAVFDWERSNFFRSWQCVGRSADIAEPGMQRAERIGATTVLLVRDNAGVLRAFANTCRHRGHELLQCGQSATARAITCPYHAWSYTLDGDLFAARGYTAEPRFDKKDFPLVSMSVEEWHGWIFVDPSATAGPLAEHVAGLEPRIAQYRPEDLVVKASHEYVIEANWKIIIENYQECYHCPSIHPELCQVSPPESGENWAPAEGAWIGGWQDLREHAVTMSLDGKSGSVPIAGLTPVELRRIDYIGVFPNLLVSLHPDYVMTHRMIPLNPGQTLVECAWAFPREAADRPDFDPSFAVDFWDITNREDWAACESVQRGLSSGHAIAGPLAPDEDAIHQFESMIARGYLGLPLSAVAKSA